MLTSKKEIPCLAAMKPYLKEIFIIKMRAQHITFSKAIKAISVRL